MKKRLKEIIERGLIEPSDSERASPVFMVPKKQKGEKLSVVDYRGQRMIRTRFPQLTLSCKNRPESASSRCQT